MSSASSSADVPGPSTPNEIEELKAKRKFVEVLISKKDDATREEHCKGNEASYGLLYTGYSRSQLIGEKQTLSEEMIALTNASGKYSHIHSPADFPLFRLF